MPINNKPRLRTPEELMRLGIDPNSSDAPEQVAAAQEQKEEAKSFRQRKLRSKAHVGGALATRLLGGIASGVVGTVPSPITTSSAAAIGGAAEAAAQKIESPDPVDWSRVGIESGLSAVPMSKIYKWGKAGTSLVRQALANVGRGAGLVEAGNLLRRYHETGSVLPGSKTEAMWDLGSSGLGGLFGLAGMRGVNKRLNANQSVADDATEAPGKIDDLLDKITKSNNPNADTPAQLVKPGHGTGTGGYTEVKIKKDAPKPDPTKVPPKGVIFGKTFHPKEGAAQQLPSQRPDQLGRIGAAHVDEPAQKVAVVEQAEAKILRQPTKIEPEKLDPDGIARRPDAYLQGVDEGIEAAAQIAKAQRQQNRLAAKQEAALLKKEQAADLQAIKLEKGATSVPAIEQQSAKAQTAAEKMLEAEKKAADEVARRTEAEDAIKALKESGVLKAGPRIITESSASVPTETGKQTLKQSFVEKADDPDLGEIEKGLDDLAAAAKTGGRELPKDLPPQPKAKAPAKPPVEIKPTDPETVGKTTYRRRQLAVDALAGSGRRGTIEQIEKGKWQVRFTDEAPKPAAPVAATTTPEAPAAPTAAPKTPAAPIAAKPTAPAAPAVPDKAAVDAKLLKEAEAAKAKPQGRATSNTLKNGTVISKDELGKVTGTPSASAAPIAPVAAKPVTPEPPVIPGKGGVAVAEPPAPVRADIKPRQVAEFTSLQGPQKAAERWGITVAEVKAIINTVPDDPYAKAALAQFNSAKPVAPVKPQGEAPPVAPSKGAAPVAVKGKTPLTGTHVVAAKDKHGKIHIVVGNGPDSLLNEYNGWKSSGGFYTRIASGKITKGMTKEELADKIVKQFGGKSEDVTYFRTPGEKALDAPAAPKTPEASAKSIKLSPKERAAVTRDDVAKWTPEQIAEAQAKYPKDKRLQSIIQDELKKRGGGDPPAPPTAPAPQPKGKGPGPVPKAPTGAAKAVPEAPKPTKAEAETPIAPVAKAADTPAPAAPVKQPSEYEKMVTNIPVPENAVQISVAGAKSSADVQNRVVKALADAAKNADSGVEVTSTTSRGRYGSVSVNGQEVATTGKSGNFAWADDAPANLKSINLGPIQSTTNETIEDVTERLKQKVFEAVREANGFKEIVFKLENGPVIRVHNDKIAINNLIKKIQKAGPEAWDDIVTKTKRPVGNEMPIAKPWDEGAKKPKLPAQPTQEIAASRYPDAEQVDLRGAATAQDVKDRVLNALENYASKVAKAMGEDPIVLRQVFQRGQAIWPNAEQSAAAGILKLEVPGGPLLTIEPNQIYKTIELVEKAGTDLWEGIVSAVKRPKTISVDGVKLPAAGTKPNLPPMPKGTSLSIDTLLAKERAADKTLMGKIAPKLQAVGYDATKLPPFKKLQDAYAAKDLLDAQSSNVYKVRGGADGYRLELEKGSATVKPFAPDAAAKEAARKQTPSVPGGSTIKGINGMGEPIKPAAPVAAKPKAEPPAIKDVPATESTSKLAGMAIREKEAWDAYFDLKKAAAAGEATAQDVRAAGAEAGRLQHELAVAVKAAMANGEPIPAFVSPETLTRANTLKVPKRDAPMQIGSETPKPAGKLGGPTSDDLVNMPPDKQEAALNEIVRKYNSKRKKVSDTGETGATGMELLLNAGVTSAGMLAGAAATPDDPMMGAIIGAGAGFGTGLFAPAAFRAAQKHLQNNPTPQNMERVGKFAWMNARTLMEMAPDYYRASVLSKPDNLTLNALVGPYGSAIMGAAEYALAGDKRGNKALKELMGFRYFKEYFSKENFREAKAIVSHPSERMGGDMGEHGPKMFREAVKFPATVLTAGDIVARRILMEAGFSELEARTINLTSEPISGLAKAISNAMKSKGHHGHQSWALRMMLPFYRTNLNQVEQNIMRLPFIGPAARKYWNATPVSARQEIMQQAMSVGVGGMGYLLGSIVPENQQRVWLKGINNFGGVYGTTASLAFLAGAANQKGKGAYDQVKAAGVGFLQRDMPLPTADIAIDMWKTFDTVADGNPNTNPSLPYGFIPPFLSSKEELSIPTIARTGSLRGPATRDEYSLAAPFMGQLPNKKGSVVKTPAQEAASRRSKRLAERRKKRKERKDRIKQLRESDE